MTKENQAPLKRNGQYWNWLRRSGIHATGTVVTGEAITPSEVLAQARDAARGERWEEALERYEYFFDHALDGDPVSYYGVRLSYCLSEWAQLGNQHAPARSRLEARARESLVEFERSRQPERFHDYAAISRELGRRADALTKFLQYHVSDVRLARSIGKFVWKDLVAGQHWSVCSEHLRNPRRRVEIAFQAFDIEVDVSREFSRELDGQASAERRLTRALTQLVLVLTHGNRKRDLATLVRRIRSEFSKRQRDDLAQVVLGAM